MHQPLDWILHARRPVARCSTPRAAASRPRATPSTARPTARLYAEELFGVEGFTGRSSLLYHVDAADADAQDRAGRRDDRARGGRRRLPPPPADRRGRRRAARRRGHRPDPAVLQQRRRDGRRPPGRARCPRRVFYRNGEADEMLFVHEGSGPARHRTSGRSATARATTSSCRSARPGGWTRTPAATSGCSTSSARPRSSRRSAIATTTASCSSTRRTRSATSGCPTRCRRGPTRATSGSTSRCAAG